MKEVVFVKQNIDKWKKFETLLQNKDIDNPDEISALYIQLMDDLSYARTFYPATPTYIYLNEISGKAHQLIYKNKKEKKNRIVNFWKKELPLLFYSSHKQLFYSFLIFSVACLIGVVSAMNDDSFVRLILGNSYVNMTLENIEKGDPLAVYKRDGATEMFLSITINNIKVSFMAFIAGILFSVGTVYILFANGVMLGAFQYFFYQKGHFRESLLTIWMHGTIEISVIIIAGCAGLVMGNSLLFPGTYSRIESFRRGAKQGLKIIIGTVPFFIIAGFIESYLTRYSSVSVFFDLLVIVSSLGLIIWYFIIYPISINKGRNLTTNN